MQLLKTKIRFVPNVDQTINFTLSENVSVVDRQEDINKFVEEETGLSINDVEDKETFRYLPSTGTSFYVIFNSGGTYAYNYAQAGFTIDEIATKNEVILRSFYLMQVYDSTDSEKQTLLHTGYYNGFNFISPTASTLANIISLYGITEDDEFTNLYLPNWYIETLTGDTELYAKFSFYNAKIGKMQLFYTSPDISLTTYETPKTDSDFYFTLTADTEGFLYYPPENYYLREFVNTTYVDKINNTLDSFDNKKPTYPTGSTFLNTGKYVDN